MKEKRRRKAIARLFIYLFAIICFVCALVSIGKSSINANAAETKEIYYKSISIEQGDTLYSIAAEYNTSVDEIKEINNLESNTIYAGEMIIVSYTK